MFEFDAKYLPALDLFTARNDVRYYLGGWFVSPHHDRGVLLRATDGHTMCVIHDEGGRCEGEHIVNRNPEMVKAAKVTRFDRSKDCRRVVSWEGKGSRIAIRAVSERGVDQERYVAPLTDDMLLEARWPDFDKVLPEEVERGALGVMNPAFLERTRKVASALLGTSTYHGISFATGVSAGADDKADEPSNQVAIATLLGAPEVLVLVMPMRWTETPAWKADISRFASKPREPQKKKKAA